MRQRDPRGRLVEQAFEHALDALAPLDERECPGAHGRVPSQLEQFALVLALEAVGVHVDDRIDAPALVGVHQREGRAGDGPLVDAQAGGEGAHEGGLAGAEIPAEQDNIARREQAPESARKRVRGVERAESERHAVRHEGALFARPADPSCVPRRVW